MAKRAPVRTNNPALIAMIDDEIADAVKEFTTREDIAIVLISQYVANMIRFLVDSYNKPMPAILEIPAKDHPYDPARYSVLSRVKYSSLLNLWHLIDDEEKMLYVYL
ncbi:V-type proton ATPase subunit F-like [Solanum dulcamara]|uniref:V-type proton ATPase subunit F-like n=1 Tax=Solanum dulcamara TaxID=45834 RepID=UPI002485B724|nr:V-type proton ATPase subunit F-like [Solanum dulcamara]